MCRFRHRRRPNNQEIKHDRDLVTSRNSAHQILFVFGVCGGCVSSADSTNMVDGSSDSTTENAGAEEAGGEAEGGSAESAARMVCERMLACHRELDLSGIVALAEMFGENGECWTTPNVLETDCAAECAAILETVSHAYPDASACWQCSNDEHCAWSNARPYCNSNLHLCWETKCGNGTVEPGEQCDGGLGCESDCTWQPGCEEQGSLGSDCKKDCECASERCSTLENWCVECKANDDCGINTVCLNGFCGAPTCDYCIEDLAFGSCAQAVSACSECSCLWECDSSWGQREVACSTPPSVECLEWCGAVGSSSWHDMVTCFEPCADSCNC
jgi:hypothetical protein